MTTATDLQADFREAMANLCAPVTVVTTMDGDRPHGTTVSAVMSLSVEPLLIAVALADTSESLALISRAGSFGVNVLGAEQHPVAMRFATKGADKFDSVRWQFAGAPRIDQAAVWLSCELSDILPGGDHQILVGRVHEVQTDVAVPPLTYHRRRFGTHVAQHQDSVPGPATIIRHRPPADRPSA